MREATFSVAQLFQGSHDAPITRRRTTIFVHICKDAAAESTRRVCAYDSHPGEKSRERWKKASASGTRRVLLKRLVSQFYCVRKSDYAEQRVHMAR